MFKMWRFRITLSIVIALASTPQVDGQNDNRLNWDIKLNVPGDAGSDYPTLKEIPRTHFTCAGREPGYYADQETNCQVFRICTTGTTYGFQSFLCPNGTLFNQAVFVCDWWMNVNCEKSQEIHNNYNEHFVNIKPGPQLLKDVRKMITHPMRNPISNGFMKSNILVAQPYTPPSVLLPNGALVSSHSNNLYVPTKQPFGENLSNDISFAATTYSPLYSSYRGSQNIANVQFSETLRPENTLNSQANVYRTHSPTPTQTSYVPKKSFNQLNAYENSNTKVNFYGNNKKQTEFESYKINQAHSHKVLKAKNSNPIHVEAQQNLVSTNIPPTVISKTIAFKSIIPGDNPGSPKSRITFKTWILKSKTGKLNIKPTYTSKNLIQSASESSASLSNPYIYNKPKQTFKLSTSSSNNYITNKLNGNQVNNPDILYNPSATTFRPNLPNRLYIDPNRFKSTTPTPPPTRYEITTFKSPPNTYIPLKSSEILSRQYLSPLTSQVLQSNQNENLISASSSQTPQYEFINQKNNESPLFTVTKQLKVNTNHNNISFTDVLTKEKIDITVNDVIKDTNKIVQSTSNQQNFAQYQNNNRLFNNNELKFDEETVSKEELTSKHPIYPTKSSKIIAIPSTNLEPPFMIKNDISKNKLSNLPYYVEPVNTIERTVSIKITIPEKIAKMIFKNDSSSDKFEVLNTGSSNYLVYANNVTAQTGVGLIPIGKLSLGKYSNISNSQDLVFSFLADSLNAVKDYSNIANQNVITTPPPQIQNYRYQNDEDITTKISHLTSSQFTNDNGNRHNNRHQISLPSPGISQQKAAAATPFTNSRPQNLYYQQRQKTPIQHSSHSPYMPVDSRTQNVNGRIENLRETSNHIYSGQLYQHPVPEVTRDYYNLPNIKNNEYNLPKLNGPKNFRPQFTNKQNVLDIEDNSSQQLSFNTRLEPNQETFLEQAKSNTFLASTNGITAEVQDSIKGTLSHPSDDDKFLTYNKDQSFYIFSQLHNNNNNRQNNDINNAGVQFIPSLGYKINDEKDKERFLSSFQINSNQEDLSTNVDYSVKHPSNNDDNRKGFNGASTFTQRQALTNKNSKIEDLDDTEPKGYPKLSPQPIFNT